METKKLGFLIIGLSIVLSFIIFSYMGQLNAQEKQHKCNPTEKCQQINSLFGLSHIAVGFLAFVFALGFYLLFFNKDEKEILEKYGINKDISQNNNTGSNIINNNQNNSNLINNEYPLKNSNDKFSLLLRPLDDNEQKVLISIREQEGITQSTLKYRANLSKAKVSQILTDFERKGLIARKAKGKTYQVFLTENF